MLFRSASGPIRAERFIRWSGDVIERVRPGVIQIKLKAVRHLVVQCGQQAVVVGIALAITRSLVLEEVLNIRPMSFLELDPEHIRVMAVCKEVLYGDKINRSRQRQRTHNLRGDDSLHTFNHLNINQSK